jgi:prepilin-type N-terminal cleavage/methylation domain-containing protein
MEEKSSKGFTIIEVLISLVIIGVITTGVIANFRASERQQILKMAAETLAADLKRVQVMSLSGARLDDGRGARGGYGIFLNPSDRQYILFAEAPYAPQGALPVVNGRRDGGDFDILTVNIPSPIIFTMDDGGADIRSVVFTPPRALACFASLTNLGVTTLNPGDQNERFGCEGVQPVKITLQLERDGSIYKVILNRLSGQISLERG